MVDVVGQVRLDEDDVPLRPEPLQDRLKSLLFSSNDRPSPLHAARPAGLAGEVLDGLAYSLPCAVFSQNHRHPGGWGSFPVCCSSSAHRNQRVGELLDGRLQANCT